MHLDVIELDRFYNDSRLGFITQKILSNSVQKLWPELLNSKNTNNKIVGFGFSNPFLKLFLGASQNIISFMPGQQGVIPWPRVDSNLSVLIEETSWPLESGNVDNVLVAHGLESCERPNELIEEIWRILKPGGEVLFIVPNRSGWWARSDLTPFGYGEPYSLSQLEKQLVNNRFKIEGARAALYAPPFSKEYLISSITILEKLGSKFGSRVMAGALLVSARKQIYARPSTKFSEVVRSPLGVLEGLIKPKPKPISKL